MKSDEGVEEGCVLIGKLAQRKSVYQVSLSVDLIRSVNHANGMANAKRKSWNKSP